LKKFGEDNEQGLRRFCPGEDNCSEFESAAGETRKAKEKNVCIDGKCPAFPSKVSDVPDRTEKFLDALENKVFELRFEQMSGAPFDGNSMTPSEFKCLKILNAIFDEEERNLRVVNNKMLEALLKRGF